MRAAELSERVRYPITALSALYVVCLLAGTNIRGQDVLTQRNDNQRTGASASPGLNQVTVKGFELLKSLDVDAPVVTQPLYVGAVDIKGRRISAVFFATATNQVYAFHADPPFEPLWSTSLGPPYAPSDDRINTTAVWIDDENHQPPHYPVVGIEATPAIDAGLNRLFVSYRVNRLPHGEQRLAALDIRTGLAQHIRVPGNDVWHELHRSRASLLVDNGIVFVAFGALNEGSVRSYQGWIHAFDARTLAPLGQYRSVPDPTDGGGIWQGSTGPAADGQGSIFFVTGNARNNPVEPDAIGRNLSNSAVRLSVVPDATFMKPVDWFTPYRKMWHERLGHDMDLGSSGAMIIPDTPFMVISGKEGILYLLDRRNMGKFDGQPAAGDCPPAPDDPTRDRVVQKLRAGINRYFEASGTPLLMCSTSSEAFNFMKWPHIHGTPVFGRLSGGESWLYVWPEKDRLKAYRWMSNRFDPKPVEGTSATGQPVLAPPYKLDSNNGMPGGFLTLAVDPLRSGAGVLFASVKRCRVNGADANYECSVVCKGDAACKCPASNPNCNDQEFGILRAFDPRTLVEVWNNQRDTHASRADKTYLFAKYVPPTIAKGRVFLAAGTPPPARGKVLVYANLRGVVWQFAGGSPEPVWDRLDHNLQTVTIAAAGADLYQMHNNGAIWQYNGTRCDAQDLCNGWNLLDTNQRTVAMAAGGRSLYQLHNDGSIWQYAGPPCDTVSCRWTLLDTNHKTVAIAAGETFLYQLQNDGSIWQYAGPPCTAVSCRWNKLDSNHRTVAIAAAGNALYQLHNDGSIWQYTGPPCDTVSCRWARLDTNHRAVAIAAGGTSLYQLHNDGSIWQYAGPPCNTVSCRWNQLDANHRTLAIAAAGRFLYQLHNDGSIWQYTGPPCAKGICQWRRLDRNSQTASIAAGGARLYQLHGDPIYQMHDNGSIWRYTPLGWQILDNNPATTAIAAGGKELAQLHADGSIWRFTGVPCEAGTCRGWEKLDGNKATVAIAAAGKELVQRHSGGSIWRYTGTPCDASGACRGWEQLDDNRATTGLAVSGKEIVQMHDDGSIWRFTGVPCNRTGVCIGWEKLDSNRTTTMIAVAGKELVQLHTDGSIWRYTGAPCTNQGNCPGWQKLDRNRTTSTIAAAGKEIVQMHRDGSIWRYIGVPCNASDVCSGWEKLDANGATVAIAAAGKSLVQLHTNGAVWRYTGVACDALGACRGWEQVDNHARTKRVALGTMQP